MGGGSTAHVGAIRAVQARPRGTGGGGATVRRPQRAGSIARARCQPPDTCRVAACSSVTSPAATTEALARSETDERRRPPTLRMPARPEAGWETRSQAPSAACAAARGGEDSRRQGGSADENTHAFRSPPFAHDVCAPSRPDSYPIRRPCATLPTRLPLDAAVRRGPIALVSQTRQRGRLAGKRTSPLSGGSPRPP